MPDSLRILKLDKSGNVWHNRVLGLGINECLTH